MKSPRLVLNAASLLMVGAAAQLLASCGPQPVPADAQASMHAAEAAVQAGNFAECVRQYSLALAARSDLVSAYSGRAGCYVSEGNAAPAVLDYDQALRLSPADPELYLQRGSASEQIGNRSAARADLVQVGKLPSVNPDQIVRAAQGLTGMGFYSDAMILLKVGLDQYAGQWQLLEYRAEVEVLLGDDVAALKDFDAALRRASGKQLAAVLAARADYYRLRQQYKASVADYGQAIGLDPTNYALYSGRAKALTNLGNLSAAERDYGFAISFYGDVSPRNTWPIATLYEDRGIVRMQTGQRANAVADFEKALATLTDAGPKAWIARLHAEIDSAKG